VLYEEVEQTGLVRLYFGELFENCVGYEVGAAGAGGKGEGFLEPGDVALAIEHVELLAGTVDSRANPKSVRSVMNSAWCLPRHRVGNANVWTRAHDAFSLLW
jgi:hypothetical protein